MRILNDFPPSSAPPFVIFFQMWTTQDGAKCSMKKAKELIQAEFPEYDILHVRMDGDDLEEYFHEELSHLDLIGTETDFPANVQAVIVYGESGDNYYLGESDDPMRFGVQWYFIDDGTHDGPSIRQIN